MAEQLYKVIFEGEVLEGSQVQEVKRALAKLYNKREDQVEHYFSGKRLTVKKDADYETAMKYVKAFERAGAVCKVEELETQAGLEQPLVLEKETEKPVPKHRLAIPHDLYSILKFVYGENQSGRMPTYKDIGARFDITKPTTRKKVGELRGRGYLRVVKRGRSKILELSEKGKELF